MIFNPLYFLMIAPALILAFWAQSRVRSTFTTGDQVPARMSGAQAARYLLDQAGLQHVGIEEVRGTLSDHYDPSHRVLRLSSPVYHNRSASAVGIAAHEAGHALQHATNYLPLVFRSAAVPAAQFGPTASIILLIVGAIMQSGPLILLGIAAFGAFVVFQLINLPVEFDASSRAKRMLDEYQIVDDQGAVAVKRVLNAAAWTYVAATLQAVLTLLYYVLRFTGGSRD